MTNREILAEFFKAENERNWEVYRQFLHEEISWQLFGKKEKNIVGIENYMQVIKNAYSNNNIRFSCVDMQISADGNRIAAYLVNDSGVRSLDIFDFKDGMIYREFEFILD